MHAGRAIGNYTAQADRYGNIIVCKGDELRNGYRIIHRGGYHACLRFKVAEYITRTGVVA